MRSLPRAVAATSIGKSVAVELLRKGENKSVNVTVGQLPASEEAADDATQDDNADEGDAPDKEELLGLSIAPLTDELRSRIRHRAGGRGSDHHRGQAR